jgi:hypothetical protein
VSEADRLRADRQRIELAAAADLATACDLLKRAADVIIAYEQEIESGWPGEAEADGVLPAIGAFLARVRP